MSRFKQINEKKIWLILKSWPGGKIEFADAYWNEDEARLAASKLITGKEPYISLHSINLHGYMVDRVK